MSNTVIFDQFGNIKKSANWLLIGIIALTIIGVGFLIYRNWGNMKVRWQPKSKETGKYFSAIITFDEESNLLNLSIQAELLQEISMRIFNSSMEKVSEVNLTEFEQGFDLRPLPKGNYECVVYYQGKIVSKIFTKK
jgi:hypothetical protein